MQQLAENIWIVDGKTVPFLTLPFTTRMTIIRLANGDLWLHSPINYSETLASQIARLGTVKYLIAPNHLHHLFIPDWQVAFPDAQTFGTDELIEKRDDIPFDGSLNEQQTFPWQDEIGQVMFTGSRLMEECVFFHNSSRTLIVTDLIENFPKEGFTRVQQLLAKGTGILAPHGKMPIDWRLSFYFSKAKAREHLRTIKAWQPETIVMAHGCMIEQDAQVFLDKSFSWLEK